MAADQLCCAAHLRRSGFRARGSVKNKVLSFPLLGGKCVRVCAAGWGPLVYWRHPLSVFMLTEAKAFPLCVLSDSLPEILIASENRIGICSKMKGSPIKQKMKSWGSMRPRLQPPFRPLNPPPPTPLTHTPHPTPALCITVGV